MSRRFPYFGLIAYLNTTSVSTTALWFYGSDLICDSFIFLLSYDVDKRLRRP